MNLDEQVVRERMAGLRVQPLPSPPAVDQYLPDGVSVSASRETRVGAPSPCSSDPVSTEFQSETTANPHQVELSQPENTPAAPDIASAKREAMLARMAKARAARKPKK